MNNKHYAQLYRELLHVMKNQLSEITLSVSKKESSIDLKFVNLRDEISYHLNLLENVSSQFTLLKTQIYNLVHIEDITLETDNNLMYHVKMIIGLISELRNLSVNKKIE